MKVVQCIGEYVKVEQCRGQSVKVVQDNSDL